MNNTLGFFIHFRAVQETGDISPSLKEDRTVEENNESANENLVEVETQPDDTS